MKKRYLILILILLFLIGLGLLAFVGNEIREHQQAVTQFDVLAGVWVNENFLAQLKKTKSLCAAEAVIKQPNFGIYACITTANGGVDIKMESSFHLPGQKFFVRNIKRIKPSGYRLKTQVAMGSALASFVLNFDADGNPRLLYEADGDSVGFVRISQDVSPINEQDRYWADIGVRALSLLLNDLALVGKYQDDKGRVYEFTPDFKALWPDKAFYYDFYFDPLGFDPDGGNVTQFLETADVRYYFTRDQNVLVFYLAKEHAYADWYIKDTKPLFILQSIK